jgi:hypothetical protein
MGLATNDDDFSEEIQNIENIRADTPGVKDKIFSIQTGKGS